MISQDTGYSISYLVRKFHQYLDQEPPEMPVLDQSDCEVAYLLIDGLWFGRWYVMMVYRQSKNLTILHISVAGKEASTKIEKDLKQLLEKGYRFTGIVSAVEEVFPGRPHQICLAHMHRRIVAALGRRPRDYRVAELKRLADHVWLLESREALRWWKDQLNKWVETNWEYMRERRFLDFNHWWYIHKGVIKAVRIMQKLPKTSFVFLHGHPLMPKTTNELEAQFGHLAKRWLAHRGLKKTRWEKFMKWFVYLYNHDKLSFKKSKSD